jgi:drug/metabolite transporter (DMT)-like permease
VTVERPTTQNLHGIAAMLAAVFVFSIMDSSMKHLSQTYGAFEVACLRCIASIVFLLLPIAVTNSWRSLHPANPLLHVARAALGIGMLGSFVYAVRRLSMAEAYALFLCAPLMVTALSVPLLGERVPMRRWLTIGAGLAGTLLMLRPKTNGFISIAAAAAAASACCYALSAVSVRALGRSNSSAAMVMWFLVLVGIGSAILAAPSWRTVEAGDWGWIALIGISGALGQYWVTDAFRSAPPSVVAPFEYSAILWAFAIDWVFWSVLPSVFVISGATVVIGCGLAIIWDERRLGGLAATAAVSPPP